MSEIITYFTPDINTNKMKKTIFLLLLFACTQPSFCRDAGTKPGTPRFYLGGITKVFGSWTIHAKCLDPDYAKQMEDNPHFVTYQWGIKTGDKPIEWTESDSSAITVNTSEESVEYDNMTVYLKTKDASGNESKPVFVNVYGRGVINLLIKTFVVNSKGEVFEDNGSEILYDYEEMPYAYKDPFITSKSSICGATVTNDK